MNHWNGKTILVTGATGFIGTHLVNRLQREEGTRLILLSRKAGREIARNTTWVTASLEQLSPDTWRTADIHRIDLVFHLGSFTPKASDGVDHRVEVYRDNLIGTRSLLESFPSVPEKIVFSSSIDVYAPPQNGAVLDEKSALGPATLHGASKLFCEQLIRNHARSNHCGFALLRYGHIFGPGEEEYRKLIPTTIRSLSRGDSPVLYGNGSSERDLLYVDDAVEATWRAACSDVADLGPVNIVRGESQPIREIAETLIRLMSFPGTIQYLPDKPQGCSLRFSNRLMREVLGEWKFVPLEVGLRHEVEHFRNLSNE